MKLQAKFSVKHSPNFRPNHAYGRNLLNEEDNQILKSIDLSSNSIEAIKTTEKVFQPNIYENTRYMVI